MRDFMALISRPDKAGLQYLVADSTDHENYQLSNVLITPDGDHDENDAALERLIPVDFGPALDSFDSVLLSHGELAGLSPVRWRLGPRWLARSYDLATARGTRTLPVLGDRATADAEGASLVQQPDAARAALTWTHDRDSFVPSTVANRSRSCTSSPTSKLFNQGRTF